jgi:hypothetical protein
MAEHIHPPSSEQRWLGCPGCDEEAIDDVPEVAETFIAAVRVRKAGRGPVDLDADLQARWRPNPTQIAEASAALASREAPEGRVYTVHVLINKHPSWWTGNEVVRPIEGHVYTTNDQAWEAAKFAAQVAAAVLPASISVCAGWTAHDPDGTWAVFEA